MIADVMNNKKDMIADVMNNKSIKQFLNIYLSDQEK